MITALVEAAGSGGVCGRSCRVEVFGVGFARLVSTVGRMGTTLRLANLVRFWPASDCQDLVEILPLSWL